MWSFEIRGTEIPIQKLEYDGYKISVFLNFFFILLHRDILQELEINLNIIDAMIKRES